MVKPVKEVVVIKDEVVPDLPEDYFDNLSKVVLHTSPHKITEDQVSLGLVKSYIQKQELGCMCKGMSGELHFTDGSKVHMWVTDHCLNLVTSKNSYSVDPKLITLLMKRKQREPKATPDLKTPTSSSNK